jgi:hypothetical protein
MNDTRTHGVIILQTPIWGEKKKQLLLIEIDAPYLEMYFEHHRRGYDSPYDSSAAVYIDSGEVDLNLHFRSSHAVIAREGLDDDAISFLSDPPTDSSAKETYKKTKRSKKWRYFFHRVGLLMNLARVKVKNIQYQEDHETMEYVRRNGLMGVAYVPTMTGRLAAMNLRDFKAGLRKEILEEIRRGLPEC